MDLWKSAAFEEISHRQNHWEFMAFRAGQNSADVSQLLNSTRTFIAKTYLHNLIR